jgi:hypothetical protein
MNFKRIRKRSLDKINNKIKQRGPAASARPTVPFETVYDGLAAGVEVVVLGLDDAVVHGHGGHGELAGLAKLIETVHPCHALFHNTLHRGSDLIRIIEEKGRGFVTGTVHPYPTNMLIFPPQVHNVESHNLLEI